MPWVKFTRDFDWKVPGKRAWLAFKSGSRQLVTTAQADDAIKAGAAIRVKK
jgi:hypothetical protein